MRRLLIIFLLILLYACSSSPVPNSILQPEKMQKVVYDLIRIDEFLNNFASKDSTTNIKTKRSTLYEQVFKVNNTTRKEFYLSYKYYQQHPDIQKGLYDSLVVRLNRKKEEVGKIKPDSALIK